MIGYGNSYFISTILDAESSVLPVNTVAPAISGTAQEGQTLTCSTGTWTGTPVITYAYQWKRNNVNIGSATNSTYLLVSADVGQSIKCTVTATNGSGSVNADSNTVTPTAAVDSDAQAFITAASITNPTQQSAINQLVVDLKGYGLWSKMKALYPFVGGTAAQHKWNLKDPRDLDAAFRIFWNGGVTHSSNGVQFGGVNGWANTYCNPESNLGLQSNHLSFYSRTQVSNTDSHDIGCQTGAGGGPGGLIFNFNLFQYFNAVSNKGFNDGTYPANAALNNNNNTLGLQIGSRTSINSLKLYFNNSLLNTNTTSKVPSNYPNYSIYIGATNSANTAAAYSSKQCAFASIGDGLTDTEAANLYTAVQAFQVSLSRNV